MEKTKSKVRRFAYAIIIIVLVILNIYTLYIYFHKLNKYNSLSKTNFTIQNKLSNMIKDKEKEDNKLKNIEENIDKINNIDKYIEDIKNKFYLNESKYEKLVLEGKGSKKIAYLTFDDGPYQISYQFLDVLDKYDILVTFFVIGNKPDDRLPIYKEEVRRGHTIANHTYYHSISNGLYNSVSSFSNQIKKNEDFILKETGIKTNILRFPGGSNQAKGLKNGIIKEISNMGYGYVDWDLETGDGKKVSPTIKESIDNVLNKTNGRDIVVVLMHDYSSITLSALPSIIEGLEKQNYIMLPLFYESVKVKKS
ncbi:MAG: polysaccharide deacetylase family protein [Bacilli bacterium]